MSAAYGPDFGRRVFAAVARRIRQRLAEWEAPLLLKPVRPFHVAFALEGMVRWHREGCTHFECPFDFSNVRAWTVDEVADFLVDLAMRVHRAWASDSAHGALTFEELRERECFHVFVGVTNSVFFSILTGGEPSAVCERMWGAVAMIRDSDVRSAVEAALREHDVTAAANGRMEALIHFESPEHRSRFVALLQVLPATSVPAAVASFEERITRAGRPLSATEFDAAIEEIRRAVAFVPKSGGIPSA